MTNATPQLATSYRLPNSLADLSMRAKLVLAFLSITILSVSLVGFFEGRITYNKLLENVGATLKDQAVLQGLTIGELLDHQLLLLQAFSLDDTLEEGLAQVNASYPADSAVSQNQIQGLNRQWIAALDRDPIVQSLLINPMSHELRQYLLEFPVNVDLMMTDMYGVVVASTKRPASLIQVNELWWQATWLQGKGSLYIGQPVFDDSSQSVVTKVAIPLRDQVTQQPIGVLVVSYRLSELSNFVDSVHLGRTGNAQLLLPDGRVLKPGGTQFDEIDSSTLAQLPTPATTEYTVLSLNGISSLVSWAPVVALEPNNPVDVAAANLGWRVLVRQAAEESLQPLAATAQIDLAVSLCTLLLAVVLAFVLARGISTPIHQLTQTARQIAAGELSRRVDVARRDEIGQLAVSFNRMADAIQERDTTLMGIATSLEQRVGERTLELQQTNIALAQQVEDRKRIEGRLEAILNNSSDAIAVTTTHGLIETTNPAFSQLLGYQASDVTGRELLLRVFPNSEHVLANMWPTVLDGRPVRCELTAQGEMGHQFTVDVAISPIIGQDEKLAGVVFSLRDISESKHIEEELQGAPSKGHN